MSAWLWTWLRGLLAPSGPPRRPVHGPIVITRQQDGQPYPAAYLCRQCDIGTLVASAAEARAFLARDDARAAAA